MTIPTTIAASGPYTPNGATTAFPFGFKALSDKDVTVALVLPDGTEEIVSSAAYDVTLAAGDDPGGTVTMLVAPVNDGRELWVYLDPTFLQEIKFEDEGAFNQSILNQLADEAGARAVWLRERISRGMLFPRGEAGIVLPEAVNRKGKFFAFDAGTGAPVLASGSGGATDSLLVTASDGAAGTLWTTVQGFINKLLSSAGSSVIGFIQTGVGAVLRSLQAKARDAFVSPEDFGCVAVEDGGGAVDNSANMLKAMQSGRPVDLHGKRYLISSEMVPTSLKGLVNGWLAWKDAAAMVQQKYLLKVIDISDVFVDRVGFDLGTVEDCGAADDSSRGGLMVNTSNQNVTFNERVQVTNCIATGYGNGTGINVRSCKRSIVRGNRVYGRRVAANPDPGNDCQNGIDITQNANMVVEGNVVYDCQTKIAGVYIKRFSRGILITGTRDSVIANNVINGCDQNFDFSGAVVTGGLDTTGNVGLTVTGNSSSNCRTWGMKFANCFRDGVVSGNIVRNFGLGAFVFSGHSAAPTNASFNTQRVLVIGNIAIDPTGEYNANDNAFQILQQAASTGYPRGIKMIGNVAYDSTGGGNMPYGFYNEVPYDGASLLPNEIINCRSVGHTTGPSTGFQRWRTAVTGVNSLAVTNATLTNVPWTSEQEDGIAAHDDASNPETISIKIAGTYRISFNVVWAANATGYRKINILKNGGTIPGSIFTVAAVNGDFTCVTGELVCKLANGDGIRLEAYQNSGGALNLMRDNSVFMVELLEIA